MNDSKPTTYQISDDPIIRFCAFYMALYLGSLILGGVGIFEIVFGLMILSTRILIRWRPSQASMLRFFGFKQSEQIVSKPTSTILRLLTFIVNLIVLGFYVAVSLFFIQMGIRELIEGGFLNQNLIYILFFKFK